MLLAAVVETSRRVAETTRRLEKIELLAALLRQLEPEEVEPVVAFLSGYARQGRIGVGYAAVRGAGASSGETGVLEIRDVDRALSELAGLQGPGSDRRKRELLDALFARST